MPSATWKNLALPLPAPSAWATQVTFSRPLRETFKTSRSRTGANGSKAYTRPAGLARAASKVKYPT